MVEFFYINADTCGLGFCHLSKTTSEGEGVWFWEGLQKVWQNSTFLLYFMVSISGGVGRVVTVVTVVERGNATGALGCFQPSLFHFTIVYIS